MALRVTISNVLTVTLLGAACSESETAGSSADTAASADSDATDATDGSEATDGSGDGSDATDGTDGETDGTDGETDATDGADGAGCALPASCTAPVKDCVGLVDNTGKTRFGLRISELALTQPKAFTTGLVKGVLGDAIAPSHQDCSLNGSGSFSWLLEFDTAGGNVKVGGAKPVADPSAGYAFMNETIPGGLEIAPISLSAKPDGDGKFATETGEDVVIPVYLDAAGPLSFALPLKSLQILDGTLDAGQSCIGAFNAEGLSPDEMCLPTIETPTFITGATLDAFITLEDADKITVGPLSQTLCVLLSGDASKYGGGEQPVSKCIRDMGGQIEFKGDWCSMTNAAAEAACDDAMKFTGSFAASSVLIVE